MDFSKYFIRIIIVVVCGVLLALGVYSYGKARADRATAECQKAQALHATETAQANTAAVVTVITMPASEKRKTLEKWIRK